MFDDGIRRRDRGARDRDERRNNKNAKRTDHDTWLRFSARRACEKSAVPSASYVDAALKSAKMKTVRSVSVTRVVRRGHRDSCYAHRVGEQRGGVGKTACPAHRPTRADTAVAIEHELRLAAVLDGFKQRERGANVGRDVDDRRILGDR